MADKYAHLAPKEKPKIRATLKGQRMCFTKKQYISKEIAEEADKIRGFSNNRSYRCPICKQYHNTKKRNT